MSSNQQDPMELINQAEGTSLTALMVRGIGGYILSVWVSLIAGFQTVFEFLFLPFELLINIATESVASFVLEPMGIIEEGARITGQEIQVFDFLALPIAVVIALASLGIVIMYLQFGTTSNLFPGLFVDNQIVDLLFTTPEEEAEGEE